MSDTNKSLELVLSEARHDLFEIESEQRERKGQLWDQVRALESRLNLQLDEEFGSRIRRAQEAVNIARKNVEDADIANASARAKYPIGTVLVQWKDVAGRWSSYHRYEPTGVRGVVEVFTRESPRPANLRYSTPAVGSLIVRQLGKDGKPGIRFFEFDRWKHGLWYPEGERPKEAK